MPTRRLTELAGQRRAWHARMTEAGLRRHARAFDHQPLAATPVLSASLVARHLGCSAQGAGAMLRRLAALGIVNEATPRARWRIYVASDLDLPASGHEETPHPLSFSEPAPAIDREAIETTLDALFRDLERLEKRTRSALAGGSGTPP